MSDREEVLLEPGFVLHHRPYRNSSLIVDCLTANFGRQALVAQGARRSETRQRPLLQPFRRLRLSWVRRGEMGRLTQVELDRPAAELSGDALLAGFYVNELMLRLVPRGDHNDAVFSCYSSALDRLAESRQVARALRLFELGMLDALGFGINLERDCRSGEPILADRLYAFEHEGGLTAVDETASERTYRGGHLISLREHELRNVESLRAAKHLLGDILQEHLGERPLKTRAVLRAIVERGYGR
jgi:DNA repair protein RecO (recombination protein O)